MQISCFVNGWEQERIYLHLDPETGEITREVYTRGVNTEFSLSIRLVELISQARCTATTV